MRTIRAKELKSKNTIIDDYNKEHSISKVVTTGLGTIMVYAGKNGSELYYYNPMDVVVIQ